MCEIGQKWQKRKRRKWKNKHLSNFFFNFPLASSYNGNIEKSAPMLISTNYGKYPQKSVHTGFWKKTFCTQIEFCIAAKKCKAKSCELETRKWKIGNCQKETNENFSFFRREKFWTLDLQVKRACNLIQLQCLVFSSNEKRLLHFYNLSISEFILFYISQKSTWVAIKKYNKTCIFPFVNENHTHLQYFSY